MKPRSQCGQCLPQGEEFPSQVQPVRFYREVEALACVMFQYALDDRNDQEGMGPQRARSAWQLMRGLKEDRLVVPQDGLLAEMSRTPGKLRIMRYIHFFIPCNESCLWWRVCVESSFISCFLNYCLSLRWSLCPHQSKIARRKSDFSWGGRTFCFGGSRWLHLLLRDVLASGIFFLPHAIERSSLSEQTLASGQWPGS